MIRISKVLILVIAVTGLCGVASAGDMSECSYSFSNHPADGATNLPLNPMFLQARFNDMGDEIDPIDPTIHLEDGEGNQIETGAGMLGWVGYCSFYTVSPAEELLPETTYTIVDDSIAPPEEFLSFTTGTARDDEAPIFDLDPADGGDNLVVVYTGDDIVLVTFTVSIELGSRWIVHTPSGGTMNLGKYSSRIEAGDTIKFTAYDSAGNSTKTLYTIPESDKETDDNTDDNADSDTEDDSSKCTTIAPGSTSQTRSLFALILNLFR
ncbi:MAG: hypothetical protein GY847_10560 [Proteobacteria bacterium]|nr:hypothetical protein [Pseudomonadota bacterium]